MLSRPVGYLAFCLAVAFGLSVGLGHAGEPVAPAADVQLHIGGDVEHPLTLKAADLVKLTRHTVRVQDHDKRESVFEGWHSSRSSDWQAYRSGRIYAVIG